MARSCAGWPIASSIIKRIADKRPNISVAQVVDMEEGHPFLVVVVDSGGDLHPVPALALTVDVIPGRGRRMGKVILVYVYIEV